MIDTVRQDVIGALRGLWKSPGFAVAALITLALGIGATSAIFTVVKAVLLTPLPYDAPEQRVMVWSRWVSFDKTWVASQEVFDYREFARTMSAVAMWANTSQNLTDAGEPVRLNVGLISSNTFDVRGRVQRWAGRLPLLTMGPTVRRVPYSAIDCGKRGSQAIVPSSAAGSCSTTCRRRWWASCRKASACLRTSPRTQSSRRSCGARCG